MNYSEIEVKRIINKVKENNNLFGLSYNINLYQGCEYQCIYCDYRSKCYQVENFDKEILIKINSVELLRKTLPRKSIIGTIGFGLINDPYTMAELKYGLTGQALKVLADQKWPVHIITKNDLVIKDLPSLVRISETWSQVSFLFSTSDDKLAEKLESGVPSPTRRFLAMKILAEAGIYTGMVLMPTLPYITDTQLNFTSLIESAHKYNASYILPTYGISLRDQQKECYFNQLEKLFPGLREKYEKQYGRNYVAESLRKEFLENLLIKLCKKYDIATYINRFPERKRVQQLGFFD